MCLVASNVIEIKFLLLDVEFMSMGPNSILLSQFQANNQIMTAWAYWDTKILTNRWRYVTDKFYCNLYKESCLRCLNLRLTRNQSSYFLLLLNLSALSRLFIFDNWKASISEVFLFH